MKLLVLLVAAAGCSSKSAKGDGAVIAGQSGQAGVTTATQSASGGDQGSSSLGDVDAGTTSSGGAGGVQASGVGGNSATGSGGATAIGSGGTIGGATGGTSSAGSGGTVGLGGAGGMISLTTGGGSTGGTVGVGGSTGGGSGGTPRSGSGGTTGGGSGSTAGGGAAGGGIGGTAGPGSGGIGGSSVVTGGDAGAASSDYCSGDQNKLSYLGQDLSPAATNFPSAVAMDCCDGLGVNLHTLAQLGFDLDLDITFQAINITPGQYPVGPTVDFAGTPFRSVTIRKYGVASTTEPPRPMSGTVTTLGIPSGVTARDMGFCLNTPSASSPSSVISLYLPHVTMIPNSLRGRFQIFRLADQSITPEQAQAQDLNSLALAATPLLDLGSIYYVEQSTGNIGTPNASTIGNSLRNPTSVVPLAGLPFVVVVDDVPIYLGTFFRLVSSMIPVGPVIIVDNITDDIVPISAPKQAGNDPRFDPSIVQVLTDTGKLVP
jgi:hypothetical protein